MAKFDLKKLKQNHVDIQKDIDSIEKNRTVETIAPKKELKTDVKTTEKFTPIKKTDTTEKNTAKSELVKSPKKQKAEKITVSKKDIINDLKVASITLPTEVKNYLKIAPKINGTTITQFIQDIIEEEQINYRKKNIDVTKGPDYSNMPDIKSRRKGEKPVIIPIKISESSLSWLKMAAMYEGMNVSLYMEALIRKHM